MEDVLISLTSVVNLIVAVINLTVAIINSRRKEKDPRSAKRKSQNTSKDF
ncbi:hypothetical protein J8TS2_06590 [Lederbergia ruris]|uniref:Uncharacterized protein n=1 Tax=Lederbergia ruris TaxID=217495 RepID=A0ABQ4KEF0_9BACI|nr:hypothetical protein [Lederbergia ruris]GIN56340.1 hypothetical protein J8TS2_06590 [Lederbergia ruris]